jgi:HAD superfamily hydrolase (TIGR01509 family)
MTRAEAVIPQSLQLVVLDLDGLLVDSDSLEAEVVEVRLAERGIAFPDIGQLIRGLPHRAGVHAVEHACGLTFGERWWSETAALVRETWSKRLAPLPGAPELLTTLGALGLRWCVATNSRRTNALLKMRVAGLIARQRRFHLFAREDLPRAKPSPAAIAHVYHSMRTPAADCLVLDDSPRCVESAFAAGARGLLVTGEPGTPTRQNMPSVATLLDIVARLRQHRMCVSRVEREDGN